MVLGRYQDTVNSFVCTVADGKLVGIDETKNIVKTSTGAEADGKQLDVESLVSMNFWCYPLEFIEVLKTDFPKSLANMSDPQKDEYLLPIIADEMLKNGTEFSVLPTADQWFGVTYKEDKASVIESFKTLYSNGIYNSDLYPDF